MNDLSLSYVWAMRCAYFALALVVMFFHLLPLNTVPSRFAPPDLLMTFSFAWAMRRPDFVPAVSIAVVMLLGDLILQRPPGFMAMLILIGAEYLKSRFSGQGESSFAVEWTLVAVLIVAITLINRVVLGILSVPQAPVSLTLIQMIATMVAYPLVVIVSQWGLGVRKLAPNEAETLGAKSWS